MNQTSAILKKYEFILGTKNKLSACGEDYCQIMAQSICTWKPRENGFRKALSFFLEKRKEILRLDLKAAFLSPQKIPYGSLWTLDDHLHLLNENSSARLAGTDSKKFYTPISDHPGYKILYRYLSKKDFHKRWMPKTDHQVKLRHPPLLVTKNKGSSFRLYHAWSMDIPAVLNHLERLWKKILRSHSHLESLDLLAQFEWWFFNTNPTGRSAAALGDCLSLVLQKKKGVPLRKKFIRLDFYALGRDLDEYTRWRIKNFQSQSTPAD